MIFAKSKPVARRLDKTLAGNKKLRFERLENREMLSAYYISQSTGNDTTGTGAIGSPWKTLAKASIPTLAAGDSILLKCGDTWNEELDPKGSGTAASPITISSYGTGSKPIIDRANANSELVGIKLVDQGGFKITNIEFAHTPTGIYGQFSASTAGHVVTQKYIWIENCYFHDSLFYGSYAGYPSPKNISVGIAFFTYESVSTYAPDNISLQDVTVKNCTFKQMTSGIWTNNPDNFNMSTTADNRYNFANFVFQGDLFEQGWQWQQGIRGVNGGVMRDCVTVDVGRGFSSFNGVAGSMFWRSKYWLFENCEWGFISRNNGASGDGEAFDFEGNCSHMVIRNCLFHDTEGPGFLVSEGSYTDMVDLRIENSVLNGKALASGMGRYELYYTQYADPTTWTNTRFYLAPGESLAHAQYGGAQNVAFVNSQLKYLSAATSSPMLVATASASSVTADHEASKANDNNTTTTWTPATAANEWLQLDFGAPVTVNEFRIKEDASSSTTLYAIQYWDDTLSQWVSCFNGRTIGTDFVAPIVSRTMQKARLMIFSTTSGSPSIAEFHAYNDIGGYTFVSPRGVAFPQGSSIPTTATSTALTSSTNPSTFNNPVTFTATVTCTAGTPNGTVTFKDGTTPLYSVDLNTSGVATYSTVSLTVGTHPITAVYSPYSGSPYCTTSTSAAVVQTVNPSMSPVMSVMLPTGDLTVLSGTLFLANAGDLPDGASLTVDAGAILIFDPSATAGAVVADAALSPVACGAGVSPALAAETAAPQVLFASNDPASEIQAAMVQPLSNLAWLGASRNAASFDIGCQDEKKDLALAALDSVMAEYGQV